MTTYSFIDESGETRLVGTISPAPGGGSQTQLIGPLSVDYTDFPTPTIDTQYSIALTGSPSGGSFKLKFAGGADSDPIAFDAAASDVSDALVTIAEAASRVPSLGGCFATTADPLPAAVVIEFVYGLFPVLSVAANNLTGGSSPNITLTRVQNGQFPSPPLDLHVPVAGSKVLGAWIDTATFVAFDQANSSYGLGQLLSFDGVKNYWFYLAMAGLSDFASGLLAGPYIAGSHTAQLGSSVPLNTTAPIQFGPDPAGYTVALGAGHADFYVLLASPTAPTP